MGTGRTFGAARLRIGSVLVGLVLGIVGVFAVEPTAHHDDAAQYWTMAGRLARTGEPFYVAAVDHKGPLWVGAYRLAWAVTGEQAWFWFLMAVQVVVIGAATAAMVGFLLRSMGTSRHVATASATVLALYLVFGPEGYSNLLYGRNITAALTAGGAALAWRAVDPQVHRPSLAASASGAALGLATQTVFTTAIPALALVATMGLLAGHRRRVVIGAWSVGFATALGSVVVWYVAKGAGPELRTWLWDYNLAYGASDASLVQRVGRAAQQTGTHLLTRPFLLVAPLALGTLWNGSRRNTLHRDGSAPNALDQTVSRPWRRPIAFAGAWWVGELAAIAAPDRWFGHYWILLAAPTACLGGLAAATAFDADPGYRDQRHRLLRKATVGLAGLAVLYTLPGIAVGAVAAAGFSDFEAHQVARQNAQNADLAELREVVDEHSTSNEPILVWASAAGPYVALDRPAASRFDRRTWLTGEIYGSTRLATVPGVWTNLMEDLAASNPPLIVEYLQVPIEARSPLGILVDQHYELIVETNLAKVHARTS